MSRASEAVSSWRRRQKLRAVVYKGGCCLACGYVLGSPRAMTFHHLDPAGKLFGICDGSTRSWARVKAELDECVLVCIRCHIDIHEGLIDIRAHIDKNPSPAEGEELLRTSPYALPVKGQRAPCPDCGGPKAPRSGRCRPCHRKTRFKIEWPSHAVLNLMVAESSLTAAGKQLGVSGNAVKKRLRNYGKEADSPR